MSDEPQKEKTSVLEAAKQEAADIAEFGNTIIKKASPLSVGLAVIMAVFFAGLLSLLYFGKETILGMLQVSGDIKRLQSEHDHCNEELTAVKVEVKELRGEVTLLKSKVANN